MLDDDDIDAAVAVGVLTAGTAASLRAFSATRRNASLPDDEQFRLLTGFNDIFVAIAIAMVLIALAWLGSRIDNAVGSALVATASWALAEFFTRKRHMALPSILLLLGFVGGVLAFGIGFANNSNQMTALATLIAAFAAYAHWLRFKVPIAVAVGSCAAFATIIVLASSMSPDSSSATLPLMLASGLCIFALALWWDMSDPARRTRRADVAFWLHLAAAPLIVHPAFSLLGLTGDWTSDPEQSFAGLLGLYGNRTSDPEQSLTGLAFLIRPALALAIYLALAIVALVIDRRALMVSALAYLLFAITAVFRATGPLSISFALAVLVAGAGLLLLSAYWRATRQAAFVLVPQKLRAKLPAP